jgi:hypothetical protein
MGDGMEMGVNRIGFLWIRLDQGTLKLHRPRLKVKEG